MAMSDIDPDVQRLDAALEVLSEHFDSLIIMATRFETDGESGEEGCGTVNIVRRRGNYCASLGQVQEWLIRQKQAAKAKEKE